MPLWTIHHSPGIFTTEEKQRLAADIADHYEKAGLPRFYVMTIFSETTPENFYVGGESTALGVRVVIEHIARHSADQAGRHRIAQWIKDLLAPYLDQHPELHWEFHVDETSEDLWMINGLIPPPARSAAEQKWARDGVVSAY